MKRSLALVPATLAFALILSSCSSAPGEPESNASGDCIAPGAGSDSLVVEGALGKELTLSSAETVVVTAPERTVLIEGKGDEITADDRVNVSVSMFNGNNNELIFQTTEPMQIGGPYIDVINDAMKCSKVGDRTVTAVTAAGLYGEGQVENLGIADLKDEDSIILVLDFLERIELLDQATGTEVPLPEGAPKVEISPTGEPTITIPEGLKAPEKLTVYEMVKGEGPVVTGDQTVTVHYRGIIWRTGEEFDSSWSRGEPTAFPVGGVIDGFKKALEGYTVGSRLVSVVPAEDGGYGADWLTGRGYEADDVMVFVLDILSAS